MSSTKNFPIEINELKELVKIQLKPEEQKEALDKVGGLNELCTKLNTNTQRGLNSSDKKDLEERASKFGKNEIPPKPPKLFLMLMFEAVQDTTLIILIVAAVVSLGLSFYHDSSQVTEEYSQLVGKVKILCLFFYLLFVLNLKKKQILNGLRVLPF